MGFTAIKLVKTRNLHPELDAAIQSFASNVTEDDVALVSQEERSCFAQDSRNMTNDFSIFKDHYSVLVMHVTCVMWSNVLSSSVGHFIEVIYIAATSIVRPKVSVPMVTGIGRFHCRHLYVLCVGLFQIGLTRHLHVPV